MRARTSAIPAAMIAFAIIFAAAVFNADAAERTRLMVLTDVGNEPDDAESVVRLLVHCNEFDMEGLVATTSRHLQNQIMPQIIRERIDAYGVVHPTLSQHAPGFPTAQFLHDRVKNGSSAYGMSGVGDGKDSEGSNWIITVADRADARPLWVTVWGGANTLAQSLYKVRATRTQAQLDAFVSKLRVYTISDQDDAGAWIRTNFPKLFYIVSPGTNYGAATWSGISGDRFYGFSGPDFNLVSNAWVDQHVQLNHGPLGAKYPDVAFIMEGDTPSWLYLLPTGLGKTERPDYGSWGGRYVHNGAIWTDSTDRVQGIDGQFYTTGQASVWRWRNAYQNEFQARMDWCVQPFSGANHPPVAVVQGALERTVLSGSTVTLSAAGSSDPDGNTLSYDWMFYDEPSTYDGALPITNAGSQQCSFTAPSVPAPKTIHMILTVKDNGTPPLHRYQRVIVTVTPSSIPYVNAGVDATIAHPSSALLDGTVTDDGQPGPVSVQWSKVSGPGTVNFANATSIDTSATFSVQGSYVLRLTANDGANSASDDVAINVVAIGSFLKGINFNGSAVTIEGNNWLSHSAALSSGLSFPANPNVWTGHVSPNPAVDAATQSMLGSAIYSLNSFSFSQTISNGSYSVYFWLIENHQSNYRAFDIRLEGSTVASQIGTLAIGAWRKYGPYTVSVNDGVLSVDFVKNFGDPHVMGMAIYSSSASDTQAPSAPGNLTVTAKTDATVSLSWSASTDNTGVTGYDVYRGSTKIGTTSTTSFTDSGLTSNTSYSYTVKAFDAAGNVSAASNAATVTTTAAANSFIKGINFNGSAVTIEGKSWLSYSAALSSGLSFPSSPNVFTSQVTPVPAVDSATYSMLNSAVWSTASFGFTQTIGNGSYQLYFWVLENHQSNFRAFDIKLEGNTVASQIGTMGRGSWAKYGPYPVTVNDGALNVDLVRHFGDPHLMGMAIFSSSPDTQAPTAPSNLISTAKTGTTVSLSWNASTDNTSVLEYDIYRGATKVGTSVTTSFTDSGLSANTTYSYTVKAKDGAGNVSANSNSVSVTTTNVLQYPIAVEKWAAIEVVLNGPSTGNPYLEVTVGANFTRGTTTRSIAGFYDGSGVYRIRFMPDQEGTWTFTTTSNTAALNGHNGSFNCTAASAGNQGPVSVRDSFHFKHANGAPFFQLGTTCYDWTNESTALRDQTIATLAANRFNKIRMLVFPKYYSFHEDDPEIFPFEGSKGSFNFDRPNHAYFQKLDDCVRRLRDLGIQADIIITHPYDNTGIKSMPESKEHQYIKYLIARLSAYQNVWWSLCNEWELKNTDTAYWDRMGALVQNTDPHNRLRSIHNVWNVYDHGKAWVTHLSMQAQEQSDPNLSIDKSRDWRSRYGKPVVWDEVKYEGNLPSAYFWGRLTPQEMTERFWHGTIHGTYVGHSETYQHPENIIWWSRGGVLHGQSPARINYLKQIIDMVPGKKLDPVSGDLTAAQSGTDCFLYYYRTARATSRSYSLPSGNSYQAYVIDTWNMQRNDAGVRSGNFSLTLPDLPYIAVLFIKAGQVQPLPPVAANDAYATARDTALTVNAPGVLNNDSDPNSDSITAVLVSGPAHGTLSLLASGAFTYTPASGYTGSDSFSYKARDTGGLESAVVTVSITISSNAFVKGINFNGSAVTIEGNSWLSYSAALSSGLSFPAAPRIWTSQVNPNPATDTDMRSMLNSAVWNLSSFGFSQTLNNGTYDIYLWVLENHQSNFRSFNVNLEGQQVASNIGTMAYGNWTKYGPYRSNVSDGALNVDLVRNFGDPHVMGMAIYTAGSPDAIYLSDLNWTSATSGWGPVERDRSNGEAAAGDGKTQTLNGVTYAKGLGVHSDSDVRYALNGNYTSFLSDIGIDDEVGANGSVVFRVYLDGVLAYDSGVLTGTSATKSIQLNISGKNELRLVVTQNGDLSYDHANWAIARIIPIAGATPAALSSLKQAVGSEAFASEATATPNPAQAGDAVNFSAVSLQKITEENYVWDFGDGNNATGSSVTHVYSAPGDYSITVTVKLPDGTTSTSALALSVTGSGDQAASVATPFTLKSFRGTASFSSAGREMVSLSGVLPNGQVLAGQSVSLDVGGVQAAFTLNARGQAKTSAGTFKANLKTGLFSVRLNKGTFTPNWTRIPAPANAVVSEVVSWKVTLEVNALRFASDVNAITKVTPKGQVKFKR